MNLLLTQRVDKCEQHEWLLDVPLTITQLPAAKSDGNVSSLLENWLRDDHATDQNEGRCSFLAAI